ncbi:Tetraspanin-9 [Larimichthys crocea]|uniref:Tetraspanin-9 n=1 Tax=Larimichthys crocea TaxID=215358 RepID=A0A6G0HWX9_LARCR|nr:Tetraspanin-9 [Larimichthys crocea]
MGTEDWKLIFRMSVSRRCLCCVKYLMFVFNLIFWLGGCGLFGIGVWLSFTQAEFSSLPLSFPSLSAANLLLVAGGITMVTGFLGCLGALKEQRCLLFMFFVILLLLVLTEVTLMLVIHIFHDKMTDRWLIQSPATYVALPLNSNVARIIMANPFSPVNTSCMGGGLEGVY